MQQNVAPNTAGDQESGWLYSQTNSLGKLGAKLTYCGESPFLLRLVFGVSNEQSSDTVSWLPLYVSNDITDFRPLTELNVPFRNFLPKMSLVSIEDIRCVCPNATHMITRRVEKDLCKMAHKITDDMDPHKKFAIQRFEESLTRWGWGQEANFSIHHCLDRRNRQSWQSGKVDAVSLSGICALTVVAYKQEMKEASTEIEDLF